MHEDKPYASKEVGIIMGSVSDLEVMKKAAEVLEQFGVSYEITIVSAHRTPERLFEYSKTADERGLKVIIAGAGGAAHLPGMVASLTTLPVIGVPVKTTALSGLDSLLSIVQMPKGVPVATVAIDGAANAALLAVKMLGIENKELKQKINSYKIQLEKSVLESLSELDGMQSKE